MKPNWDYTKVKSNKGLTRKPPRLKDLGTHKEIIVDSLKYCQENKGLLLHAWVIMTNHIHLILSSKTNKIEHLVRDIKNTAVNKLLTLSKIIPQKAGRSG